jgi:hypothetical protein
MSYFTRRHTRALSTFGRLPGILCVCAGYLLAAPTPLFASAQTVAPPAAATSSQTVEPIVSMRDRATGTSATLPPAARKKSYELSITGNDWLDSGLNVVSGEHLSISATGSTTLADGRSVSADGLDRGWKDLLRQFPLNQAKTGALIGRVSDLGASVPFLIGAKADAVMPTSGHLYLRTNLTDDLAGTGALKVTIRPVSNSAGSTEHPVTAVASPISAALSPALFASIPRRVGDEAGSPGDMVNFAFVGTQAQVEAAFKNAGWVAVDKNTQAAVLHGLLSTLSHQAYVEMPMSTLYLFGRPQDLSFARADPLTVAAERHHLRVWKSPELVNGRPLWVGSATHDIGFERDQRNGGTTHKIDPNIDEERKFLVDSFDATGAFSSAAYVTPNDPLRTANTATGGSFSSDGRIAVMELKPDIQ